MYKGLSRNMQRGLMRGIRFGTPAPKSLKMHKKPHRAPRIEWPIYVTAPDASKPAGIAVKVFYTRQAADLAGFDWIGR